MKIKDKESIEKKTIHNAFRIRLEFRQWVDRMKEMYIHTSDRNYTELDIQDFIDYLIKNKDV